MLILMLLLSLQRETFNTHYEAGVEAFEEGRYEQALEELGKAIKLRPKPAANARTRSMLTINYHPYHYMGEAAMRLERDEEALKWYRLSRSMGEYELMEPAQLNLTRRITKFLEDVVGRDQTAAAEDTNTTIMSEMLPIFTALGENDLDAGLEGINQLAQKYPDYPIILQLKPVLEDLVQTAQEVAVTEADLNRRLNENMVLADKAYGEGDLPRALEYYQNVRAMDPDQPLAGRRIPIIFDRLRQQWIAEGRDDEEIEAIIAENQKFLTEARADAAKLRADLDESRRDKLRLEKRLDEVTMVQETPEPEINITFVPFKDNQQYTASIRLELTHQEPITYVALHHKKDDLMIRSWNVNRSKEFRSAASTGYAFEGERAEIYVLVRDASGVETRKPYSYNFPQDLSTPWWEEPLIQGGLMFFISSLIAFIFFRNKWLHRKAFRARFNPYIAGAPVLNERMFYGRHMTLKQILNTLHNNSLMIYGERRIGKTSFLHRLHNDLKALDDPQYVFIPAFIDLQGVAESEFFQAIEQEVAAALEPRGISLEAAPVPLESRVFISRLRKYIRALKDQLDKKPKLVLLLDEVDVMNGFSEHTNQQLRSVFMKGFAEHIVAVMAGININKRWESEGSPWYNFFEQIELKPFGPNHADDLIVRPVRGIYQYTPEAVRLIKEITGCKPYLIQKMCLNLITHILAENKRRVTEKEVSFVYENMKKEFDGASA